MTGKTIAHYKIFEKLGEGGSPREITETTALRFSLHNQAGMGKRGVQEFLISRGKWASK